MARKKKKLVDITTAFKKNPPLGGHTAEHEKHLSDYYSLRPRYVEPALQRVPGVSIFIGPKGVGKSAVLEILSLEPFTAPVKKHHIQPNDLALWSIARSDDVASFVYDQIDPRWINKVLWQFLFMVESLKKDYGAINIIDRFFAKFQGKSDDMNRIRRLIEKSIRETEDVSLSSRFLALVQEIKIGATIQAGTTTRLDGSATLKPSTETEERKKRTNEKNILYDLVGVMQRSTELLQSNHLFILDDLDLDWTGTPAHKGLIEGLIQAIFDLSRGESKLSFAAAIRSDIFDDLKIDNIDKYRTLITRLNWDDDAIEQIILARLKWASPNENPRELLDQLLPGVKRMAIRMCSNSPRRLVYLLENIIHDAKTRNKKTIEQEAVEKILLQSSRDFVVDLAVLHRRSYPGLDRVLKSLRVCSRVEFSMEKFHLFCVDVASRLDNEAGFANEAPWVSDFVNSPIIFASLLAQLGALDVKANERRAPEPYNHQTIDEHTWFAVAPQYALAVDLK